MKKMFACIFLFCFIQSVSLAQSSSWKRAQNWYFGYGAGIRFEDNGNITILKDSQMNQLEGSASISDKKGNLLFYTNGKTIWDKYHNIMPNGSCLKGHESSTQSALIVPKPCKDESDTNIYYVFTADQGGYIHLPIDPDLAVNCPDDVDEFGMEIPDGINFSIVDMSLNGGLGEVIQKNIPLLKPATEKLAATFHENGKDIWVAAHHYGSDRFYTWLVTESGIVDTVVSAVGSVHEDTFIVGGNTYGDMQFSADGKNIALCIWSSLSGLVEFFEFNKQTGVIHSPIELRTDSEFGLYDAPYSIAFSGRFVYVTTEGDRTIIRYNIENWDSVSIDSSKETVYQVNSSVNPVFHGIQKIPNSDKLLAIRIEDNLISEISGNTINLDKYSHSGTNGMHFPVFIYNYLSLNFKEDNCSEVPDIPNIFTANNDGVNDFFRIDFNHIDVWNYKLEIYNRWGNIVFKTINPSEKWDGTNKMTGENVPEGVYYVMLYLNGNYYNQTLTLIR